MKKGEDDIAASYNTVTGQKNNAQLLPLLQREWKWGQRWKLVEMKLSGKMTSKRDLSSKYVYQMSSRFNYLVHPKGSCKWPLVKVKTVQKYCPKASAVNHSIISEKPGMVGGGRGLWDHLVIES